MAEITPQKLILSQHITQDSDGPDFLDHRVFISFIEQDKVLTEGWWMLRDGQRVEILL